jgi:hypothetical protein
MDTVTAAANRDIEAAIAFFPQLIPALWLLAAGGVLLSWSRVRTV